MRKILKETKKEKLAMYDIHICLPENVMRELKKQAEENFVLPGTYARQILAFALFAKEKE